MSPAELRQKWNNNAEAYETAETGSGIHDFVNDLFSHPDLFNLKSTVKKTSQLRTYVHNTESREHGKPDFVLYISKDVIIPCEVKCFPRLTEGIRQLQHYRLNDTKQYGILTDGNEWRFYRSNSYNLWTLDKILAGSNDFRAFWEEYLKPENYYAELFLPSGQDVLFDEPLDLNDEENRKIFFKETAKLIANFRTKIKIDDDKTAVETAYAYLIHFILYKVLVDNRFKKFENEYRQFRRQVAEAIRNRDLYNLIVFNVREISEYISKNLYRPFASEQAAINEKLVADLHRELTIDDIAPWLDIIVFINRFDFANLQNEIFGFVYENYLKDLYGKKNWGQYFTAPGIVNFMMEELGYNEKRVRKCPDKISIIDPACGAGTFLYSAVNQIVRTIDTQSTEKQTAQIKKLIDKNVFGLDVAGFPLYLAELSILIKLLPLIVNENNVQPIEHKLKLFKTKDSISEFIGTGISAQEEPALDYRSFLRDDENLTEMLLSMQGNEKERLRFDYVVSNPPYIGYNECAKQKIEFVTKIQNRSNSLISMGNVFGVNLHTVPGMPKPYAPKPNLYAFFVALGLALLKKSGKMCFILPQTLLTASDLDVLRYHLAKNTTIDKIVTFSGNLFTNRGVKSQKTVVTSSLIIFVTKKMPKENHCVKTVNYLDDADRQKKRLSACFDDRSKTASSVRQSELAENIENWNFIKYDKGVLRLLKHYNEQNFSIEEYRRKCVLDYNEVQFDKGLVFDKKKINTGSADWLLPNKIKDCYRIGTESGFIATENIRIPQGSQGLKIFENKYKIIWRYMNPDRFYFSDEKIMLDFNWVIISSENRREILFLLSLLNSKLSNCILGLYLKNANEQALLVGIKAIKKYIRIPKMTAKNQKLKEVVIAKTEALLDFGRQAEIKKEIDDLIFAMYFDVQVKDAAKNEFYRYVNSPSADQRSSPNDQSLANH